MKLISTNARYTQAREVYDTVAHFQKMCIAAFGAPALLTHQPGNGRWIDEHGETVLIQVDDEVGGAMVRRSAGK